MLNKFTLRSLIFLFLFWTGGQLKAQPVNIDCQNAFEILDPISWCSGPTEFTNVDAPGSGYGPATCWTNANNDVWFKFTAFAKAINVVINGAALQGTLDNPEIAIYAGTCGGVINELECQSDALSNDAISAFQGGLVIGTTYYIRVDGRLNETGTFQICINNYNPPEEPGQDCFSGSILCDKSPFVVQFVTGGGIDPDEAENSCIGGLFGDSEMQSTWFKWTAENNGTLTFTITPLKANDDIDFVLYELPNGINDCTDKELLRCMATACEGPTGLDLTSTDLEEDLNCDPGEDGFVRFIDMVAGSSYALIINNFTESGTGFNIEFGGSGEFRGPTAAFDVDPLTGLKCDQDFTITDFSSFDNGQIIGWEWNFGDRAVPQDANTQGPHSVNYESFGEKFIVLTIETDLGCTVTEVLPIYVEPCCEDVEAINIGIDSILDLSCADDPTGLIDVFGTGGFPEYTFSIDGEEENPLGLFDGLAAGSYQINVIDIKGCEDSIIVDVDEPLPLTVDAGADISVILGFEGQLNASYNPGGPVQIFWTPEDGLSCTDCLNPVVVAPGTTTYTITIIDANGCIATDQVTVTVRLERPVYGPNIFTPNRDGSNDYFNIFVGPAAEAVEELLVFDRWGNKVYEGKNVPLNDTASGWDGKYKGRYVNPGVFTWMAKVRFVDKVVQEFSGDVTVYK